MFTKLLTFMTMMLAPVVALAQDAAADPGSMVKEIIELANGGLVGPAIGTGIMLLLVLAKKFSLTKMLPAGSTKWAALGMAALGAIGPGLIAGADAASIIGAAVSAATTAVGSYEFFGRKLSEKIGADA